MLKDGEKERKPKTIRKEFFYTAVLAFFPPVVYNPLIFSAHIYISVVILQETNLSSGSYKGDKIPAHLLCAYMIIYSELRFHSQVRQAQQMSSKERKTS